MHEALIIILKLSEDLLCSGRGTAAVVQGIRANHRQHPAPQLVSGLHHHLAAHGVPDEHDLLQIERLSHRGHIRTKGLHGPVGTLLTGITMAGQVQRHHPIVGGENIALGVPVAAVAVPAVHEHQRGLARTLIVVVN